MKENRKSPTKITPELIERMKELVELGMQNKDICKELGIGSTTLTRYKKKYNISYTKLTAEDKKDEIISLYKSGKTVNDICKILGYKSPTTIKNILNKYNVKGHKEEEIRILKENIIKEAPSCFSAYELAKKVGCVPTTARKYIKEFNLKLKDRTVLTDEDINNITLEPLKYDFNAPLNSIPAEDKKEYLENKIRHIIVKTRKYVPLLVLNNYGINSSLLSYYKISAPEINSEFGLVSEYGSSLESYVASFCDSHNIEYVRQKTFDDCQYRGKLRFDYYFPDYDTLIEVQGKQHYEAVDKFGGKTSFEEQLKKDAIKKEWCEKNHKQLIVICYRDLYKKDYLEILFSQLVAKRKSSELLETPEVDNQQLS